MKKAHYQSNLGEGNRGLPATLLLVKEVACAVTGEEASVFFLRIEEKVYHEEIIYTCSVRKEQHTQRLQPIDSFSTHKTDEILFAFRRTKIEVVHYTSHLMSSSINAVPVGISTM